MQVQKSGLVVALVFVATAVLADQQERAFVSVDENLWVAFYDVPSRRFRDIRNAFVKQEFAMAASDLGTSASHLRVEADRALPELAVRLNEVADRMMRLADDIEEPSVTIADLDALFGRAHWLLAQHYLDMARQARDRQQYRVEGRYLWATTHHLERAVLWSNARIDRKVLNTLERLRDLAVRLQDDKQALKADREKPLVQADKTLRELGKLIERPVVLPAQLSGRGAE